MTSRPQPLRRAWLAVVAIAFAAAAALAALASAGAVPARAAAGGFVQRCGTHFCVGGQVTYFAGANSYDVFTYGSGSGDTETQYMDKPAIDSQMANLQADGITVLRTWMFDHESWHGFEPSKNTMNEQEWAEFDYILFSASQHGIRVIPALENYWTAYGGINAVLGWEGVSTSNSGNFFNPSLCAGCLADYEFYVNYALNRVNHYTGVAYKNDPTIFSWELMNEPRYQNETTAENTAGTVFRQWEDTVGAYIKGIDPNHMVDNGIEGQGSSYGYGSDNGVPYVYECQSPYIDFCSAHIYPTEGWANLSVAATQSLITKYANDAHTTVGKPFFLGEFNTDTADRSTYWTAIYSTLESTNSDADAFWWYMNISKDGLYGVMHGDSVLSIFTAHSNADKARSGTVFSSSPTPSASGGTTSASPSASASASQSPSPSASASRSAGPSPSASGGSGCHITYATNSQWAGGFTATVTINNTGAAAISAWTVKFAFPGDQKVTSSWNDGTLAQSGQTVTATNASYNGTISPGANTSFGIQGTWASNDSSPTAFTLNGTTCT